MRVTWEPGTRPEDLQDPGERETLDLQVLREQHDEVDHGVLAVEALVYCFEARVKPPQWLVDWFGERLASWLDGKAGSIDQALQVGSSGRGQQRPRNRLALQRARSDDAFTMLILNEQFELSIDDAADMVHARNLQRGKVTPEAGWLAEGYRKHWCKDVSRETRELVAHLFQDQGHRREFLATFPREPVERLFQDESHRREFLAAFP